MKALRTSLLRTALILGSVLLVVACGGDNGNNPAPNTTKVRLLHLAYDAAAVDFRVDGQVVASNIKFNESSGYQNVAVGIRKLGIYVQGTTRPLIESQITINADVEYTLFDFPPAAAFSATLQEDLRRGVGSVNSRIRFVNATTDQDQMAMYIAGRPDILLGPSLPAQVTQPKDLKAGKYRFEIMKPGDTTTLITFDTLDLKPGVTYTIVAHGTRVTTDAYPFGLSAFVDSDAGTQRIDLVERVLEARVMAMHAVVDGPAVSLAIDGNVKASNVAYSGSTPYFDLAGGSHLVTVTAGSVPVLNQNVVVNNRHTYTIIAAGTAVPTDVKPMLLEDETIPDDQQALVRFINLIPDAPALDVLTPLGPGNDYALPGMEDIAFRGVSRSATTGKAFLKVPSGTIDLKFREHGTDSVRFSVSGMKFEAGKIYTLWSGGRLSTNATTAYLVRHN